MAREKINADLESWYTVSGDTVQDIADAVSEQQYVKLQSGTTYTHNGTSQITHDGDTEGDTFVDARKATIEVRGGPVVEVREAGIDGGWFYWMGGDFVGSDSTGEIGFKVVDTIWSNIEPHTIKNCETAVVFASNSSWNEGNTVRMVTRDNDTALMLLGTAADASVPTGSNVSTEPDNGGTQSLRASTFDIWASPRENPIAQTTCYGVYESEVKPYTSHLHYTIELDTNTVGWRMHGEGYPGSFVQYHTETPGNTSGGTGIVVDKMERHPPVFITRIGGSSITEVTNNQDLPLLSWDVGVDQSGSSGIFGPKLIVDGELGDPIEQYTTAFTDRADERSKQMNYTGAYKASSGEQFLRFIDEANDDTAAFFEYRDGAGRLAIGSTGALSPVDWDMLDGRLIFRDAGSSSAPAVEIGNSGAGIFVNGSGELVAVNEAGNTTTLI